MNWQILLTTLVIIFTLGVGFYFLKVHHFLLHHQMFAGVLLSVAAWSLGIVCFVLSKSDSFAVYWMRLVHVGGLWVALWLFNFACIFPPSLPKSKNLVRLVIFLGVIYSLILFIPNYLFAGIINYDWGKGVIFDPVALRIFSLVVVFFVAAAAFIFLVRSEKAVDKDTKLQLRYIFWGIFLGSLPGIIFNIVLPDPVMGQNFKYVWLGPTSGILVGLVISYALFRHYLSHPKVLIGEIFSLVLLLILSLRLFFAQSKEDLILQFVVLILTAFFSFFLVRSIFKEVDRLEKSRHLKKQLDNANIRLKELEHAKNEFLSIAAHQLRTPLSVIKGYLSLIEEGVYGKTNQKMSVILNNISISIERLIHLVDQFLDISQLESGKTDYTMVKSDMVLLAEKIVTELRPKVGKEIAFNLINKFGAPIWVTMDQDKISNVLFNLIDNSIKYTGAGKVEVQLEADNKEVIVRIVDTGIGLSDADQKRVFSKFFRSHTVMSAVGSRSGTGLGLYIAAKFISGHKGKIWCKSKGEGKGSEFGFSLPNT